MPEMRTAIDKRIPVDAGKKEIGTYLKEIMRRIDRGKETPELSSAMQFHVWQVAFNKRRI